MTNREKFNAMTNEQMADFMDRECFNCNFCAFHFEAESCANSSCKDGFLKWLESEVEE